MAIKSEMHVDNYGRTGVILKKSRGKLNMAEMQEYLRIHYPGVYIIVLRAGEDNYNDWLAETTGDEQELFLFDEKCPVCGKEAPTGYCPKCGTNLNDDFLEQL